MTSDPDLRLRLRSLPADFRFGVATAATCIESRTPDAGRLSIWDVFAAAPGRVTDGTVPLSGPDHWGHRDCDLSLVAGLGVDSYRFSLPWSALSGSDPILPPSTSTTG